MIPKYSEVGLLKSLIYQETKDQTFGGEYLEKAHSQQLPRVRTTAMPPKYTEIYAGSSLTMSVEIQVRNNGLLSVHPHNSLDVKVILLKFKSDHVSPLFKTL